MINQVLEEAHRWVPRKKALAGSKSCFGLELFSLIYKISDVQNVGISFDIFIILYL